MRDTPPPSPPPLGTSLSLSLSLSLRRRAGEGGLSLGENGSCLYLWVGGEGGCLFLWVEGGRESQSVSVGEGRVSVYGWRRRAGKGGLCLWVGEGLSVGGGGEPEREGLSLGGGGEPEREGLSLGGGEGREREDFVSVS